ncbi:universal stress protein [Dinoroseobacter sp. PD6]|nr:universal stress protein [Dinoroseobacter sp. PD6]MDD9717618.1 universal stress protein [Dinoroseobacter sp. PD6]
MYTRILVPVDLDNADKLTKALDLAGQTAKAHGAEVIYVDVVDAVPTTSTRTEGQKAGARLAQFAADQGLAHDIKTRGHVTLRGDLSLNVGADILKAARDTKADLIVMATHMPGLKEYFLSSNAGYVATHAPITVTVVR